MEELQNMMFSTTRSNSTTSLQPKKIKNQLDYEIIPIHPPFTESIYTTEAPRVQTPHIGPLDISETHGRCQNLLNWQRISPSPIIPAGNNAEFTH